MSAGVIETIVAPGPTAPLYVDPSQVPDVEPLVISDGKPLDSFYQSALLRLLVNALYASWTGPGDDRPWLAVSDVGLFSSPKLPPIVPDVMLSLDVSRGTDLSIKENYSYFAWVLGKLPDLVIENVSNKEGNEDTAKLKEYSRLRIPYYVIHDPMRKLSPEKVRVFALNGAKYVQREKAVFPELNLGLRLWNGAFEGIEDEWLRWTDLEGNILPCGSERAIAAENQLEQAKQRADRLAEMLRQMGANPDAV
jgi:Putative restriction endonuclease